MHKQPSSPSLSLYFFASSLNHRLQRYHHAVAVDGELLDEPDILFSLFEVRANFGWPFVSLTGPPHLGSATAWLPTLLAEPQVEHGLPPSLRLNSTYAVDHGSRGDESVFDRAVGLTGLWSVVVD